MRDGWMKSGRRQFTSSLLDSSDMWEEASSEVSGRGSLRLDIFSSFFSF